MAKTQKKAATPATPATEAATEAATPETEAATPAEPTDPDPDPEKKAPTAGGLFDVGCPALSPQKLRVKAPDAKAAEALYRKACSGLDEDAVCVAEPA